MEIHNNKKIITLTFNPSIDQIFKLKDFKVDDVNNCEAFYQIAAGKGINVSKYLQLMGVQSEIFAPMCKNACDLFQTQLKSLNLGTNFLMIEGEIRTNTTIVDTLNQKSTHIKCKGFHFQKTDQDIFLKNLENSLSEGDFLLICGSYPLNFDFESYNIFLSRLFEKKIRIMIDNDGSYIKQIKNPFNFFLKPNKQEFEGLVDLKFANTKELIDYLKKLREKLENLQILITLGKEGMLYCGKEGVIQCKLKPEKIVSTVGCGDAVLAGFIYGRTKNEKMEDCLRLAAAFAISKLGNDMVGNLCKEEIQTLKEKASIEIF